MPADDSDDFVSTLVDDGILNSEQATALNNKVGFGEQDRARIGALSAILKHRHPDVGDHQVEIEATALHLAHLALLSIGEDHAAPLEVYAMLIAHVVRNATIIAEEEGGSEMRDAFLTIYRPLFDKLCSGTTGPDRVDVN